MLPPPEIEGYDGGIISLDVYVRSPKHKASNRVDYFGLQACARFVLRFLIARGRGKRCRMWWCARKIAKALPRSGVIPTYSVEHVRRAIGQLEDAGLVRATIVKPGEFFPSGDTPDVDGGGRFAREGGRVREVNMACLLGLGPRWDAPVRRKRVDRGKPASAFVDVTESDPEAAAAAAALRAVIALEAAAKAEAHPEDEGPPQGPASAPGGASGELADVDQVEPEEAPPASAPVPIASSPPSRSSDHPCSGASDHPCRTDPGSPLENHHDPEHGALGGPGGPADDAAARPGDSHAPPPAAREAEGGPLTREVPRSAQTTTAPPPLSSTTRRAPPGPELEGKKEHEPRQRAPAGAVLPLFGPTDDDRRRLEALGYLIPASSPTPSPPTPAARSSPPAHSLFGAEWSKPPVRRYFR